VTNVSVIDGTTGRSRKVTDDGDLVTSNYLEHQTVVERETREKLEGLLSYIPGVLVAVTAQVDVTRINSQTQKHLPKNEGTVSLPKRSETATTTQAQSTRAAEPGMRSIATMDVNQSGSSGGTSLETEDSTEEMENAIGVEVTNKQDPRGMPTSLAASINIPESFVEQLVRKSRGGADDSAEISRADLDTRFAEIEQQIKNSVQPHLRTRLDDGTVNAGEVFVSMVPIAIGDLTGGQSEAGLLGVFSGGSLAAGGGLIEKAVLGVLAFVAVAMMLMMVKRGGKKLELPSAQELVGVPPALAMDADVIGEAEERDAPMAGIEIGEDDVKIQKMLEQVSELVAQNPDGAASLIQRWIQTEE
jgi:flagellar biosynthesis/type III secretory pathway M-ring protein FliF/YscJ